MLKKVVFSLAVLVALGGCSASYKAIKYRDLDVQTKMSDSIFLDPIEDDEKTVYLQIRNTTDKEINIAQNVREAVESKGFSVVSSPKKAKIVIQANVLQVGKSTLENPFEMLGNGYGSAVAGAAVGAAISGATGGSNSNMMATGLAVGAASFVADAMVDVVTYTMITDIQITEKTSGVSVKQTSNISLKQGNSSVKSEWSEQTSGKKYQTRIMSVARQVNLKFEEAQPALSEGIAKSIAGLL